MTGEEQIEIADQPAQDRYEVRVNGELAGFAEYRDRTAEVRVFTHTLVYALFEGRGLASRLAAAALDDVRARGMHVVALCPFIAEYIRTHPEYADLVRR